MTKNVFADFEKWYYKCLSSLSNYNIITYEDFILDYCQRSINKIKARYKIKTDEIRENIGFTVEKAMVFQSEVEPLWTVDDKYSLQAWSNYVKMFSEFLRFAEKCFMFKNESSIDKNKDYIVYSEILDGSEVLYIRDNLDSVKIQFTFKSTKIIDPNSNDENSLLQYINNGDSFGTKTVEFVNMFISREFGKQCCNEFNFPNFENSLNLEDDSDEILIQTIRRICSNAFKVVFDDIFDNYITHFAGIDKALNLKDVIDEQFWIK